MAGTRACIYTYQPAFASLRQGRQINESTRLHFVAAGQANQPYFVLSAHSGLVFKSPLKKEVGIIRKMKIDLKLFPGVVQFRGVGLLKEYKSYI
jgi:hypothetical protein